MKLLYICTYQFVEKENSYYAIAAYGNSFWDQYSIFDEVDVLGEPFRRDFDVSNTVKITRKDVVIKVIPPNSRPLDVIKNDRVVKIELKKAIMNADAILIKPTSRKGIMAIKYAKKYKKPYMIGITGDLLSDLKTSTNALRRLYAPFIHKRVVKSIKDCKYATYVTKHYLQSLYPIEGKMCGFTDTVLPYVDDNVLKRRIDNIKANKDCVVFGLIGTYHDNRKGIDTIIQSMEVLNNPNYYLRILGVGNKEDRERWLNYAHEHNVNNVVFDNPVSGVENVFKWIDQIDIILLPSRSEGLPRCIVESISRGAPCIISNVCGMPELVNEKWLVSPNDYFGLSQKMKMMADSKELQIEAAKENHNNSKTYVMSYIKEKRDSFFSEFKNYALLMNGKEG